jgi:hypothetical protein
MRNEDFENFEEMVRAIANEVSRAAERVSQLDVDDIARMIGVDPETTKDWVQEATSWLRAQAEGAGGGFGFERPDRPKPRTGSDTPEGDPLRGAAPAPLDVPTDEQGQALAALDSGRWSVEAGTERLTGHGEGPGPSDALGLVRELRARDWITADGEVTLVGRHALSRWLDAKP